MWNSDVNKGLLHTAKLRINAADGKILVFRDDEDHCKETCCIIFRCIFYVPSCAKYFIYKDYLIESSIWKRNPVMYTNYPCFTNKKIKAQKVQ